MISVIMAASSGVVRHGAARDPDLPGASIGKGAPQRFVRPFQDVTWKRPAEHDTLRLGIARARRR
jgi:hypothetical protein